MSFDLHITKMAHNARNNFFLKSSSLNIISGWQAPNTNIAVWSYLGWPVWQLGEVDVSTTLHTKYL